MRPAPRAARAARVARGVTRGPVWLARAEAQALLLALVGSVSVSAARAELVDEALKRLRAQSLRSGETRVSRPPARRAARWAVVQESVYQLSSSRGVSNLLEAV